MSECSHIWRAVNTRVSQCAKCGETTKSPCREPECAALSARITELESLRDRQAGIIRRLEDEVDRLQENPQ